MTNYHSPGDPLTLDSGTIQTVSKIIHSRTDRPTLQELSRCDLQGRAALDKEYMRAEMAVDRLKELRAKYAFLTDEQYGTVDMLEETVGGNHTAYIIQQEEARRFAWAMELLQCFMPTAERAFAKLKESAAQFNASGAVSFQQQQDCRLSAVQYLAYLDLRKNLGYTPEEVKGMGEGGWAWGPMFANPVDLRIRGEEVAKYLGLEDSQLPAFASAQLLALRDMRRARLQDASQKMPARGEGNSPAPALCKPTPRPDVLELIWM